MTTRKSIEDLKSKFLQEYSTEKFLSIPVVKLQDYSSVPLHLTEHDVRANIEAEEEEILEVKRHLLQQRKQDILSLLSNWGFNLQHAAVQQISDSLNNLLFKQIIASYDCTCTECQQKTCTHQKSSQCNVNRGVTAGVGKAMAGFKHSWKKVLSALTPHSPDQNLTAIENFVMEAVKSGIHLKMQKEIQGGHGLRSIPFVMSGHLIFNFFLNIRFANFQHKSQ